MVMEEVLLPLMANALSFFCVFSVCHLPGEVLRLAEGEQREVQRRGHREGHAAELQGR